ncbi:hypothetical protein [Shouchella clausii]|uniref:hypothetical protein n=1 Tax=Shouchella clausii TaxID=79880 RepID=UPI001C739BF0|nr:hypothetical protein [Shouchella clausii]MBX0320258.1 hypothetical protein [Shouchella clausii]MEB5480725.1 hypothetical protein [Shouchella clausii]
MSDIIRVGIFAKTWEKAEKQLMDAFVSSYRESVVYFTKGYFRTDEIEFTAYEWNDSVRSKRLDTIYYDEDLSVKEFNLIKLFLKPNSTSLFPMT